MTIGRSVWDNEVFIDSTMAVSAVNGVCERVWRQTTCCLLLAVSLVIETSSTYIYTGESCCRVCSFRWSLSLFWLLFFIINRWSLLFWRVMFNVKVRRSNKCLWCPTASPWPLTALKHRDKLDADGRHAFCMCSQMSVCIIHVTR